MSTQERKVRTQNLTELLDILTGVPLTTACGLIDCERLVHCSPGCTAIIMESFQANLGLLKSRVMMAALTDNL